MHLSDHKQVNSLDHMDRVARRRQRRAFVVTGKRLPNPHGFADLPRLDIPNNLPESPMIAWPSRQPLRHCAAALVLLALVGCGGDGQTDPSNVKSQYNITVRFLTDPTRNQMLAFSEAETRWEGIVTGDLPDVNQNLGANECGENPATNGPFDDLTIFVTIKPVDGVGSVLGQSGPCFVRDPGDLTVIGRMEFDEDDIEQLEQEGSLTAVITHEMGHVIGFGTLWGSDNLDLLRNPSQPDPDPPLADTHFIGADAIAAFNEAGGTDYAGAKVPVMNTGGAGTVNSHWRDGVFDPELMTGYLSAGPNPLSAVTIASLRDLGYTVNLTKADPFSLNPSLRVAGPRRGRQLVNDIISDPIRRVDLNGRIVGVIRR
jgi:hypothetical protein